MSNRKTGVIIGMGEFGFHLAKSLSEEGCEVIAVDINEKRINAIKDYVMNAIVADITQPQALEEIISSEVDFIVICVGNIEKSMIATLYLKEFDFRHVYVKAITDEHERILRLLGVENVVFPEKDMAGRISKKLICANLLDYLPLSEEYSIAEVTPLTKVVGKTLKDSNFRHKYGLSVIAIKKSEGEKLLFTPGAHYQVEEKDILTVLGKRENLDKYNDLINLSSG